ncbi:MAG TPA: tetratricopeptide repeat protein [Vicinamibacteria bacterium]|nr:tetratricopeptide repeat protein [Vicinamibacteria bacterium]
MNDTRHLTLRALRPECSLTRVTATITVGAAGTRALGNDHPEVAFTMQSLGALFDETGRYDERDG